MLHVPERPGEPPVGDPPGPRTPREEPPAPVPGPPEQLPPDLPPAQLPEDPNPPPVGDPPTDDRRELRVGPSRRQPPNAPGVVRQSPLFLAHDMLLFSGTISSGYRTARPRQAKLRAS